MRNKNTITTMLLILFVISIYHLFQTYRAFDKESEYNELFYETSEEGLTEEQLSQLKKDRKSVKASYLAAQSNAFSLGLDLQGGVFVTMEVGVENILRDYAGTSADELFNAAIDSAKIQKQQRQESMVDLFSEQLRRVYELNNRPIPEFLLAKYFASKSREIPFNTPDAEIITRLKDDTKKAIDNTFNIIRTRVDQLGVASPNLQKQAGTGRILLELPGVKDRQRVESLLRASAKLEFRETHTYNEAYPSFERINRIVKRIVGVDTDEESSTEADSTKNDSTKTVVAEGDSENGENEEVAEENAGEEDGAEEVVAEGAEEDSSETAGSSEDLFAQDGDSNEVAEGDSLSQQEQLAKFKQENPFFGLFTWTQQIDGSRPVMGYVSIDDTAKVNSYMRMIEVQDEIPVDMKFLWESKPSLTSQGSDEPDMLGFIAIKTNAQDKAPLEGDVITSARQDFEQTGAGSPYVSMKMNSEGSRIWRRITKDNIGRSVAIVMDDLVFSYPNVNGVISGGNSQISGGFTVQEAKDLSNLLQAGSLPVKAEILSFTQIGPSLGAENLSSGLWSFLIAFLLTIVFMFIWYRSSGLVANVALLANLFFILGVSAALQIVFTLPGLAAVVLTMGMAVDANVLIFERIREEQNAGKSFKAAINSGFKNAFSSVMDANVTTFLTGLILFTFGLGPIKGFAVSLMIGIITSLISALFITRLILDYYANKGTDSISFGSKFSMSVFSKVNIAMTKRRKTFYGVSAVLVVLSLVSFFSFGFKTGVDFEGGRQYQIKFATTVSPDQVRNQLNEAFENTNPLVRSVAGDSALLITTSYLNNVDNATDEVERKLMATLNSVLPGSNPTIKESSQVGPTVANDIRRSATYSVIFSLLIIFLYILIRFRKYQYSLGAIAALFHDVIIVLGIFSFLGANELLPFSLEVDQAFIAAVLTIIGYSINDTVVVFDRIRENLNQMKSSDLSTVYNTSINQTISRTLITSLTTMLTVLILFFLGGPVIQGFMFALIVGIIVGTYSSIFVASPISFDLLKATSKNKKRGKA